MDQLGALQSMGLDLPSPSYLAGLLLFGLLGMWAYYRGKRLGKPKTRWLGLALMLYPYLVGSTWVLYAAGTALCAGIWLDRD